MNQELAIAERYRRLKGALSERARRLFAASEAMSFGHGGIAAVARATGIATSTIGIGLRELKELELKPPPAGPQRIRRPGGGRKKAIDKDPTLLSDLERLVTPHTRGDPMSPLRWTCKSLRKLSAQLAEMGHAASVNVVSRALRTLGYSLQGNSKVREGSSHPDRNAQFEHINKKVTQQLSAGEPAISVDTKKKELVGDFKNGGREWRPQGEPEKVRVHDFIIPELGRANPYGVYDIAKDNGWVSVGVDHDTAEFAVRAILRWWQEMGATAYPKATRLLITADGGGSNGSRVRLWKLELQALADELGIPIAVCHLPPGTSKWNKIEHRLFSFITQNWRGKPLVTHQVIVNLIAATTTKSGLQVRSEIDPRAYASGRKVTDAELATVDIRRDEFHGEWNYEIHPRRPSQDRVVL
jgi:hypothetical protein